MVNPVIKLSRAVDINNQDISGDGQAGEVVRKLDKPIIVQVTDEQGKPLAGVLVRFSILSEPRDNIYANQHLKILKTDVLTNEVGYAKSEVILGKTTGEYQIVAESGNEKITFSFTGLVRRWFLFLIFGLSAGLCFFLFGLYYGTKGLKRIAGNRLRDVLFNLTHNRFLGVFVGIGATVILQSSTATTILLVVFASSGILGLGQSLGVILGADIGTTLTAQILSLQIFDYAILLVIIGFVLMHSFPKIKDLGQTIFGFGLVFFSIKMVFETSQPLKYFPALQKFLVAFGTLPWLDIIMAMLFTFLVRSSAATIGIAVGLAFAGLMNLNSAIPIILGANLGTSFSTLLAGYRSDNAEAKRVAAAHTIFKLIIVVILYPFLQPLAHLIAHTAGSLPRQIANGHTLINVFACILFLPLLTPYKKLLNKLIPETAGVKGSPKYLSPTLLDTPAVALAQAAREVMRMDDIVFEMYKQTLDSFLHNNKELRKDIVARDNTVDSLEESITAYLTQISQSEITPELSKKCSALLYVVDDLEHIGDVVSKTLTDYIKKKIDFNLSFSDEGLVEISQFHAEVSETINLSLSALSGWDKKLAMQALKRRETGNQRLQELHNRHLE
jgi:phosphate:Na+ symporter